jgi:hypothetical protein
MRKMTKKEIKTPRPYLSWSQLYLFEKSPYQYAVQYIYGGRIIENPLLNLGKKLAETLEKDEWEENEDPDIEVAKILLPSYPEREVELKAVVGGVPILGKLDGFNREKLVIGEYKTGRVEWDQKRVDEFGQLTFYALLVYHNFGSLPNQIQLHWVPSEYDENMNVGLLGEIRSFETKRDLRDLLEISIRIKKAWEGIKKLCEEEYKANNS